MVFIRETEMKVWLVKAVEYGRNTSSVVHICKSKEIAESWLRYEYKTDIEGPAYIIHEVEIKSELAPDIDEIW